MGRCFGLAVSVLTFGFFVACASAPPVEEPAPGEPPDPPVPVSEIAKRYHLRESYGEARNMLVLDGPAARVVLFPRTSVALVNGVRVREMGRIEKAGGVWCLHAEDASRIHAAIRRRRPAPARMVAVSMPPEGPHPFRWPPRPRSGVRRGGTSP